MKKLIGFSVLIVILAFTSCKNKTENDAIKVVTSEEMQTLLEMDEVQLLDVRTPEEYAEGYIADFQNIDFLSPTFEQDILKLDKDIPVILYCRSGTRSASCAQKMVDAGFTKIYDLQGGISKWEHDGHEIVMPK
ncbi:rhodanese-like domain-containing protein [Bizionia argentinensis JUB59]|uniref:Rhodanese-like domain-containing protein n=1 Tax=Bizionia argentinensis JUB59 TaxID=1046627 RepID=G2EE99_9FLAO|nr:rhodanese-like domain-containing protein [Bizionia argentinensis]EGV43249.1 rhodanese-like domain-containing protein [Bizionia argentinensis JUB59]